MARVRLYQMRDRVAGGMLSGVLLERSDAAAIRGFADAVSDVRTPMAKHPEDYDMMFLGEQEDDGTLLPVVPPILVVTGQAVSEMLNRMEAARQDANGSVPGQLSLLQRGG